MAAAAVESLFPPINKPTAAHRGASDGKDSLHQIMDEFEDTPTPSGKPQPKRQQLHRVDSNASSRSKVSSSKTASGTSRRYSTQGPASVASRIRAEVAAMASELVLLEELDARDREAARQQAERTQQEWHRAEKEKEELRQGDEAELRKLIEEMKVERHAREAMEQLHKEEQQKQQALRAAELLKEYAFVSRGAVRSSSSSDGSLVVEFSGMQRVENQRTLEETQKVRQQLRGEISTLYAELGELEDSNYLRNQKMKEKDAARKRVAALEKPSRGAHAAATHPSHQQQQQDVVGVLRAELRGLREEAARLERAGALAQQRQRAKDDELRQKRDNESQKQIDYMEMTRARSASREREQQQQASDDTDGGSQKQEATATVTADTGSSVVTKFLPNAQGLKDQLLEEDVLFVQLSAGKKPPRGGAGAGAGGFLRPTRKPLTPAERDSLEKQDVKMQQTQQQHDLARLYSEHARLLGEQDAAQHTRDELQLTQQLLSEALSVKAASWHAGLAGSRKAPLLPPSTAAATASSAAVTMEDLPQFYAYKPQGGGMKLLRSMAASGRKKVSPPPPQSSSPNQPSPTSADVSTDTTSLAEMQAKQQADLLEIERHYSAEQRRVSRELQDEQRARARQRAELRQEAEALATRVVAKEKKDHHAYLEEQRNALSRLRQQLQSLESAAPAVDATTMTDAGTEVKSLTSGTAAAATATDTATAAAGATAVDLTTLYAELEDLEGQGHGQVVEEVTSSTLQHSGSSEAQQQQDDEEEESATMQESRRRIQALEQQVEDLKRKLAHDKERVAYIQQQQSVLPPVTAASHHHHEAAIRIQVCWRGHASRVCVEQLALERQRHFDAIQQQDAASVVARFAKTSVAKMEVHRRRKQQQQPK